MNDSQQPVYCSLPAEALLAQLGTSSAGLTTAEATERAKGHGPNELRTLRPVTRARVLLNQLRSPLLLLLVFAAITSAMVGELTDATIVLLILSTSVGIGYLREYRAQVAAAKLKSQISARTTALRDGQPTLLPTRELVPGDIIMLSAGSLVPADGVILEANSFFLNEAVLTGESFPVEKLPGVSLPDAILSRRSNCIFLGTNVRSGSARCVVTRTGSKTEFGHIAHRLALRAPETEFDRGIRHFGYLLASAMLVMVVVVFAINSHLGRPPIETLLFSVALAVGLSPELLPAILTVSLARGAQVMARHGVLVRHLNAIENLGSMDILCTDKTGTLTEGVVRLEGAYDAAGNPSSNVLELAACNAALQTGVTNPLDEAILAAPSAGSCRCEKVGEIPFDFVRKRTSIIVRKTERLTVITKGAFEHVLDACTQSADGTDLSTDQRSALRHRFQSWSERGVRVIGVAQAALSGSPPYTREAERNLKFMGFLTFLDRPKDGAREAISDLRTLGVSVKLITGDVSLVAQNVAIAVGLKCNRILTGNELDQLHDEALWHAAERTELFAEIDPNQKERIILALKKTGHVVGFLGDGVNDAPAMHAADTSISVDQAVDVAKEAADFVLLERHLDVLRRGIEEGRKTFANTLKYVLITVSANLGNMLSMAAASVVLPFLPLLAGQILLNNLLSDIPAIGLANDNVDPELVDRPRRWNMRFITQFMIEFGMLSSVFDFLTFGALLGLFSANPALFRSGWFLESLLTELAIVFVVRTRRPLYNSRPAPLLFGLTIVTAAISFAIPYLPIAASLGFIHMPANLMALVVGLTILYVVAAELAKSRLFRRFI